MMIINVEVAIFRSDYRTELTFDITRIAARLNLIKLINHYIIERITVRRIPHSLN